MRITINPEITAEVFIITPKHVAPNIGNDIEYYHFSPREKHDFIDGEEIKETIIEEYWYRYYYKEGDEYGELLCYDDSLVILYNIEPNGRKSKVQFTLETFFQTNKRLSLLPNNIYFYYKHGSDYKCSAEGRSFMNHIKYLNTIWLGEKYRTNIINHIGENQKSDSEYSLFVHSMNYYHDKDMGYDWTELNDLLYYIFEENMREEDFIKFKNGEHYNQTYLPEGF